MRPRGGWLAFEIWLLLEFISSLWGEELTNAIDALLIIQWVSLPVKFLLFVIRYILIKIIGTCWDLQIGIGARLKICLWATEKPPMLTFSPSEWWMLRFPSAACSGFSVVTVQSYCGCFLRASGLVFIHHSSSGGKTKVWNVNAGLLERKATDLRASRQQTPRMLSFYFGRNFVWRDNLSSEEKGTGEVPRSILVTFKIPKEGDCFQKQRRASLAHLKPTRLLRSLWRDRACRIWH